MGNDELEVEFHEIEIQLFQIRSHEKLQFRSHENWQNNLISWSEYYLISYFDLMKFDLLSLIKIRWDVR